MPINIQGKDYDDNELAVLAKAGVLQIGQKNDPASATLTGQALHGPFQGSSSQFGLFSYPGVRPERFSAMARPDSWWNLIPIVRSEYHNEILEIMTGQTEGSGNNAAGFCGDPPVYGNLKTCQQVYTWGDFYAKTTINSGALVGQLRNRADVPANILNAAPDSRNPFIPDVMYRLADTRSTLQSELFKMGVGMERATELVGIQGVATTQNNTYRGWMTQFSGIDRQIRTGYVDAVSGYACNAADSAVVAYNADIAGTNSDGSGRTIVETLTETARAMKKRASQVGMSGTQWVILMRSEQFQRMTDVWACQYAINRCSTGTVGSPVQRDGMAIQSLRLEMMRGQFLWIDGEQWPVVFSEGIPNPATANNTYNADIYIIPVSWEGRPLIYAQYYPMDNQYTQEWMNNFGIQTVSVLNNGLFLVGYRSTGLCIEWHFQARMRLILETPFLAARVDDVQYSYYEVTRQAIPGSSLYQDGGISYRS